MSTSSVLVCRRMGLRAARSESGPAMTAWVSLRLDLQMQTPLLGKDAQLDTLGLGLGVGVGEGIGQGAQAGAAAVGGARYGTGAAGASSASVTRTLSVKTSL
ncbi:hypothetical protein ACFYY1_41490 [Streptomyces sp. NPDC001890]|uniref:hypothetical protein n=1 Tax=Streptomyces sp. NPDC001890 TaxID=3364620 RepID=UPI0036AF6DBB